VPETTPVDVAALDALAGYQALGTAAAAVVSRDAVLVSGPDAGTYLQGQLSQDVERLAPGDTVWSWVLQPVGKVDALVRVTRTAEQDWVLDTDGGFGEAVVRRLTRFKLRTKVDVDLLGWQALALRGADLPEAPAPAGGVAVDASWPGLAGVDLLGEAPVVPEGVPVVAGELLEVARIEAGVPRMGAELTESTIPAETGLVDRTVSFTKGCYTGQELVARIDSRGSNVPRHLRGLVLGGPTEVGSTLIAGDRRVGEVTSVAHSPVLGWVALGYLGRAVAPGDQVHVDGGPTALVRDLPLRG
jgi:tRNA-modifying protein YgfZ